MLIHHLTETDMISLTLKRSCSKSIISNKNTSTKMQFPGFCLIVAQYEYNNKK